MIRTFRAGVAVALASATLLAGIGSAATKAAAPAFREPVLLTQVPGFGGLEPSLVVDRSNRVWVTAHKTYHGIAFSPDDKAATRFRAASWLWTSQDGRSFSSPPGATALQEQNLLFGDEGDLAVDATGNVYFIDLAVAGNTFTAWSVDRSGTPTLRHSAPYSEASTGVDDRPFVAAGGDGHVLALSNSPLNERGRIQIFTSTNGGRSFSDPTPIADSQFCRPLVSRRTPTRSAAVCTSASGTGLFAVTSRDGGASWQRGELDPELDVSTIYIEFLSTSEGPDGTWRALYNAQTLGPDPKLDAVYGTAFGTEVPVSTRLLLYTSRDQGRTWTKQDVTPESGIWSQASIAAAPNGMLGIAAYYRKDIDSDWQFRAATFVPGARKTRSREIVKGLVTGLAIEPGPPGEFTQAAFGTDNKLRVTYAVREFNETEPLARDGGGKFVGSSQIYFAQER